MNLKTLLILSLFLVAVDRCESSSRILSDLLPKTGYMMRGTQVLAHRNSIVTEKNVAQIMSVGLIHTAPVIEAYNRAKLFNGVETMGIIQLFGNDPCSIGNRNLYHALSQSLEPTMLETLAEFTLLNEHRKFMDKHEGVMSRRLFYNYKYRCKNLLLIAMPDYTFEFYQDRFKTNISHHSYSPKLAFVAGLMHIDTSYGISREHNGSDALLAKKPQDPQLFIYNKKTGHAFSGAFSYSTPQRPGTDLLIPRIFEEICKGDMDALYGFPVIAQIGQGTTDSEFDYFVPLREEPYSGKIYSRVIPNKKPVWTVRHQGDGRWIYQDYPKFTSEPSPSKSRH